jgi:hypothetical protein
MALFSECMLSCAQIVLDTADIVRDGDLTPGIGLSAIVPGRLAAIRSRWIFLSEGHEIEPVVRSSAKFN